MFGIGASELLLIFILGLIFVRPKDIPDLAKKLAQSYRKIQNFFGECRSHFDNIIQESDLDHLKNIPFKDSDERRKAYQAVLNARKSSNAK